MCAKQLLEDPQGVRSTDSVSEKSVATQMFNVVYSLHTRVGFGSPQENRLLCVGIQILENAV